MFKSSSALSPRIRFFVIIGISYIGILLLSAGILAFEFVYGNADGVWFDLSIIQVTYKLLLVQSALALVGYGLFFGSNLVKGIVSTVLLTLLLLLAVEKMSLWIVTSKESKTMNKPYVPFLRPDHTELSVLSDTLGVRGKPNWHLDWVPLHNGVTYDTVKISTNAFGFRDTPLEDSQPRSRYALFFGCSYTFGDGVSDTETIPYHFQANSPNYRAYNYGYMAYSPLHMLALLQQEELKKQIVQKDGFAVFTLINDHLDRVIPATRWISLVKGRFPYLDSKSMTTKGIFANERRLYTSAILETENSGLLRIMNWGYPRTHTRDHYRHLVNIIKKAQEEYIRQFGNENFYVVVFPGNPISPDTRQMFIEDGIKFLDYSGLMTIQDKMLPFDSAHPSPEVYERVGQEINRSIDSLHAFNRNAAYPVSR